MPRPVSTDKWTMEVVVALHDRPRRFNDIKRQVGYSGISQQMLTQTLKMLKQDGMVE
ncbi:winged helix-turn-helix transcriptional regulator [Agrobacterium vitis]|uniref:winged helix-turn-helix transcriptional regulator n=1 Tax=Agrobacterium vitis TaxID=373 RepID=UPI001F372030|nr:helix-turn-helix domain-containing protein [Agrobacterium vitis]